MRWRSRGWPERTPRPKAAKLPREALQRLHARAAKFAAESLILCYTIKPNASETISSAEKWLDKRNWKDWG